MKKVKSALIAFILLLIGQLAFSQSKITAIQAKLFYNENKPQSKNVSGSFSPNLVDNADFALWNTMIGEGSAEGYSNQTIIVVEITSNGTPGKNQTLKLSITEGKKVVSAQTRTFSPLENKSKYKVLFLVNDVGCDTWNVKADLMVNNKTASTMTKKVEWGCGE